MPARRLPVRPDLDQLKHQAKDLLRAIRAGDPPALAELRTHHPDRIDPAAARLSDAQLVLARSYEAPSWPRLVQACRLIDAIWRDDLEAVRALVRRSPRLLHEHATIRDSDWGPPLTYAANLGRDRIIRMLRDLGATDFASAIDRAALQGQIPTARMLHGWMGSPHPPDGALGGPAYTLSVSGTALLLELGAPVRDPAGGRLAPVDVVLETDSRNPAAKHEIFELYVRHGLTLPNTPTMALHRGRIDLLEEHLRRDAGLLRRTFRHEEIYPPELGCHDEVLATHGTPLAGATLLHMCVDYDEREIARWLLDRGMAVDAPAAVDADGFGGHTALFATVVSQPAFWMNYRRGPQVAPFAELLLDHGADPNARASLRKQLHPGYGEDTLHEYRDVTPLAWGERFHNRIFVSVPALRLIAERGGHA
ncbi:MAG TPA: ankyrin repeat domain-containing protein [Gemmatimonadales bacterium]|nr:ankyrin repeat domain-containing protein [Gemmatimonadales bacterium]